MSSCLDRLKQRKVVEWTVAYLAGAWLVMQLVEALAGRWPIPLGVQRGVDLGLFIGVFVAATLAWYHGEKGRQRVSGPEVLILATLLFIAGVFIAQVAPLGVVSEQAAEEGLAGWDLPRDAQGIAVLPFRNLSGDPDQQYFVAGMHEALISTLSHIEGLRVISRTSAMRYAEADHSAPEIARELRVASLIEGSVNAIGDRVRITVQLIDAGTDDRVWVEQYDRDLGDILVLMSQVAESVTEHVQVALAADEAELLRSAGPVDPERNELFMRGRYAYGLFTRDGIARSMAYFERAIAIDSTFAPAWAGRWNSIMTIGSPRRRWAGWDSSGTTGTRCDARSNAPWPPTPTTRMPSMATPTTSPSPAGRRMGCDSRGVPGRTIRSPPFGGTPWWGTCT